VTVDAEGRVVETEVVRGSSKVLDRRAVAIVTAAAPYGRFNAAMRRTPISSYHLAVPFHARREPRNDAELA
jgi:outer membrane biosynthesis protein TonB